MCKSFSTWLHIKSAAVFSVIIAGLCLSKPVLASTSSIMIDADSGKVLSVSNADELRYPASLTKLMTLYLTFNALEKGVLSMNDELIVSRTAASRSPSKIGVPAGKTITVKTAIDALIVKSANDCATILAEALGGTEENFAKKMTAQAQKLGMTNTTFKNASGLPNKAQKTTARDISVLASAMYHDFPQYYHLFAQKSFTYNGQTIYTHNHLLKSFKGADGMKTGYTAAAGFNIVTSAQRDGNRVIAVTMGHKTLKERDRKVAGMMENGLQKLASAAPDTTDDIYTQLAENETLNVSNETVSKKKWGIQVGAFSNYAKARNYALKLKRSTKQLLAGAKVKIEPTASGSAIIYRSKLVGLAKNDADKACRNLKNRNHSCIVIASTASKQYASAEQR